MTNAQPRGSVLIVEDDPDYRRLLSDAFSDAGFRSLTADNGDQALAILREENVDLVVCDFMMPERNGIELCRQLREDVRLYQQKVILYSCNTDLMFQRKARELGALDYLAKSSDADHLVRQVCDLAGFGAAPDRPPAADPSRDRNGERLRKVAVGVAELRVLLDGLFDITGILAVTEESPAARRQAWEAAQRIAGDARRVLKELQSQMD